MERVEKIRNHLLYNENQQRIDEQEQNRRFCCHGIDHSLDVARIMYILVLEQGLSYGKDLIYATALLHDLGRGLQYTQSVSHHEASTDLAKIILADCDFTTAEISIITSAIAGHHTGKSHSEDAGISKEVPFADLFYKADKLSRNCFECKASEACYWTTEKRNLRIRY